MTQRVSPRAIEPAAVEGHVLKTVAGATVWAADGGSATPTAAEVSYDPAASGLTATDVQAAIDELRAMIAALQPPVPFAWGASSLEGDADGVGASWALPAHSEGDLLLMFAMRDDSRTVGSPGTGWTRLYGANNTRVDIWWKVAGAAEPAATPATSSYFSAVFAVIETFGRDAAPVLFDSKTSTLHGMPFTHPQITDLQGCEVLCWVGGSYSTVPVASSAATETLRQSGAPSQARLAFYTLDGTPTAPTATVPWDGNALAAVMVGVKPVG